MNEYNPFSLREKIILITGASSGIGKSVAIECSRMGAKVIITGRNEQRLNETYSQLTGENHIQITADLSSEASCTKLIEELSVSIDGIVHCAGITHHKPFQFIDKESLEEIFAINFTAPTLMTNLLIRKKKLNKASSIVFIASTAGVVGAYVSGSLYSATKGAISGLVKGMALDLSARKIRVNTVCPAMINTNILTDNQVTEEQLIEDAKKYPLKRYGNPEEVAHAVIYLLSDASQWVTGTNLIIDGGLSVS